MLRQYKVAWQQLWWFSVVIRQFAGGIALACWIVASTLTSASVAEPIKPPGSRISLEPPKGFAVATTFSGFLDQEGSASIVLVEFPPAAFEQIRAGISAEAMARHGMRLLSTETIEGLPYEQVTVRAEQRTGNQTFDKWMLNVKGPDMVAIVTMSIPRPAPARLSDAVIRATLASVRISAVSTSDPIAALPFSIEPTSRFKYRKPLAGRGLLAKETPPPPEGKLDDVGFVVTLAADGIIAPSDQQAFGEQQFLMSKAITDKVILSSKPLQISGMPGFEYLAEGKQSSGRPLRYFVVALYPSGHPFLLMGMAPQERFDEALPEFRSMVESFRSKL
ncbi:hypothetical protein ACVIW2_000837 [Bradyrhizobium huanghuaihaiense]